MPRDRKRDGDRAAGPQTPGALAALREEAREDEQVRLRLELAVLEASGESGYRRLPVQSVLDRADASRTRFYREFADKADCYAQAYALVLDRLIGELLAEAAAAPDWRGGLAAALDVLDRLTVTEPLLAKGLLAEVHVAGGAAGEKRKEVFERLSRAIDIARRETSVSRHSPPPITAAFILSAIEAAVVETFVLEDAEDFAVTIPDLIYLAVSFYFGEDEAKKAYARARRRRR